MEFRLQEWIDHYNASADLLAVLGLTGMPRVASSNGGEWCGPCPLCGGTDRLRVWPNHSSGKPRAWCRRCGCSGDALTWAMRLEGLEPAESGTTRRFLQEWHNTAPKQPRRMPHNRDGRPKGYLDACDDEIARQDRRGSCLDALRELSTATGMGLLDLAEAWAERAALREFDGGQSRADAEAGALADLSASTGMKTAITKG